MIPARVRKPRDKATVEKCVDILTTHLIARLRKRTFFSVDEFNKAALIELHTINHRPFQKKSSSRAELFEQYEKSLLTPLPLRPLEMSEWKKAKVQYNCHVSVDKRFYSVPYEYLRKEVDIKLTKSVIEVFYRGTRICSHIRSYEYIGKMNTIDNHMPPNSKEYNEWNKERFFAWADKIGPYTKQIIVKLFDSYKIEQQGYNGARSILKLSDTYSVQRLENACQYALQHLVSPRYRNIKTILKAGQDIHASKTNTTNTSQSTQIQNGYIRGATYYGGSKK